jgi:hypothetical protein
VNKDEIWDMAMAVIVFVCGCVLFFGWLVIFTEVSHAATLEESYNPHQCTVKVDHYKTGVGGKLIVTCTCPDPVVTLSPPVNGSQTLTVSCPKGKK